MERIRKSARPQLERVRAAGDASIMLNSVYDLPFGTRVFIWCRRSKVQKDGDAGEQEIYYRAKAHELGLVVVGVEVVTQSGYDPWRLAKVFGRARLAGAVVVAATPNRFLRSEHFVSNDGRNHDRQATASQWDDLAFIANGVKAATFINPKASPAEERAEHQRRSKAMKRPNARRTMLQPIAIELYKSGWFKRKVSRYLGVHESTIRVWLSAI